MSLHSIPHLAPHTGYIQIQENFSCRSGLDWLSDYIQIMMQCLGDRASKIIENYISLLNETLPPIVKVPHFCFSK